MYVIDDFVTVISFVTGSCVTSVTTSIVMGVETSVTASIVVGAEMSVTTSFDIGAEIQKAEIAIKQDLNYTQDQPLKF